MQPIYVLGINCYAKDSSAALLKDGIIISAVEEERFSRIKHDSSFPINAINFILKNEKININKIKAIGISNDPKLVKNVFVKNLFNNFPSSLWSFPNNYSKVNKLENLKHLIRSKLNYSGKILHIPHMVSHAASSFLMSSFNDAAILVIDDFGEKSTTALGLGKDNKLILEQEIKFPHSISLFYSAITKLIKFKPHSDEFKVMGLAAFGNNNGSAYKKLRKLVGVKSDGSFRISKKYFSFDSNKLFTPRLRQLLTEDAADIAAATQRIVEEVVLKIINHLQLKYDQDNLVLAGELAYNSVLNGKILFNSNFRNIWIQPAAGDSGSSIGAAAYIYFSLMNKNRLYNQSSAFLGPEYDDAHIILELEANKLDYEKLDEPILIKKVANLLVDNKILAWFQGKMEFGPRALGNRSILANPLSKSSKIKLNKEIKFRESFRPFAPIITFEDKNKYFQCNTQDPYDFMLIVCPVKKQFHDILPSITHANGSARLQTVKQDNKKIYSLLKEFEHLTGYPILINTSLNVNGEPIVNNPKQAIELLKKSNVDFLVINNFLVKKS